MIFLDTSFLIAISMPHDDLHATAKAWSDRITDELLITEYVLVEFVNAMSRPGHRDIAHVIAASLEANMSIRHVAGSDAIFRRAMALHATRRDKSWSLTDCTSFVAMSDAGCHEALTYDQHFEQAGFKALLRRMPGDDSATAMRS